MPMQTLLRGDGSPLFLLVVIPIAIVSIVLHFTRSTTMLDRWAAANGLRLVTKEYRWLVKGPFFWRSGKNQAVYRITAQDAHGQTFSGFARCGGWFFGMLSDRVEVRWDAPPPLRGPGFHVIMPDESPPPPPGAFH
jgi:hypothetical protein